MRLQTLVVSTREVLQAHREIFTALPQAGVPLLVLVQHALDCLAHGAENPLSSQELLESWRAYAVEVIPEDERVMELLASDAFCRAFYALYRTLHDLQTLLLTSSEGSYGIGELRHLGWSGEDLLLERTLYPARS